MDLKRVGLAPFEKRRRAPRAGALHRMQGLPRRSGQSRDVPQPLEYKACIEERSCQGRFHGDLWK